MYNPHREQEKEARVLTKRLYLHAVKGIKKIQKTINKNVVPILLTHIIFESRKYLYNINKNIILLKLNRNLIQKS